MESMNQKVLDSADSRTTGISKRKRDSCSDGCISDVRCETNSSLIGILAQDYRCCNMNSFQQQSSQNSMMKNYSNFMTSGLPQRLMFYRNGKWEDYHMHVVTVIRDAFRAKKAITEVILKDHHSLFDFVHMVEIDAETSVNKHLGWIDDNGCHFFPELSHTLCDSHNHQNSTLGEKNVYLRVEPNSVSQIKMKFLPSSAKVLKNSFKRIKIKEESYTGQYVGENEETVGENDPCNVFHLEDPYPGCFSSGKLVELLARSSRAYATVQNMLLLGMGTFINANDIVGIFNIPPTSIFGQMRLKRFQKQVEISRSQRGNENIRYCWLASSKESSEKIMLEGLGNLKKPIYNPMHGSGIHLSPAKHSNLR